MRCVICEKRPSLEGSGYCHNCNAQIEAEKRRKRRPAPVKYLVYRGHVVGLFPNGNGTLKAELLKREPERLPKSKVINLDRYCEGFDRDQIKKFKRCVLRLAGA